MARPEEAKVAKAMKAAKTAEEMRKSWHSQRPGYTDPADLPRNLKLYTERKPEMIYTFAHNALTQLVDKGVLDPKTRYLAICACYMMEGEWDGLLHMCCNAKAAGATDEEIMEIAFIACYATSKRMLCETGGALIKVFETPIYKNIKRQK